MVIYRAVRGRNNWFRVIGPDDRAVGTIPFDSLGLCGYGRCRCLSRHKLWGIGLLSVFSFGFALGLTGPTVNLLVADINSERRAVALNILNLAWALGAVVGPPMLALFAIDGHLGRHLWPDSRRSCP
jgi:MFS family permease